MTTLQIKATLLEELIDLAESEAMARDDHTDSKNAELAAGQAWRTVDEAKTILARTPGSAA